jgi:hypothetical protein
MSHTVSQIAATAAGLALLTTGTVAFFGPYTKSLAKGIAVSVSLAVFAAVLISVARNYGS